MSVITVKRLIKNPELGLNLEILVGKEGLKNEIVSSDINRPGLALAEHFEFFGAQRIQLLGKGEIAYLQTLSQQQRLYVLTEFFKYKIPCFIIAWRLEPPSELIQFAQANHVPILRTSEPTGKTNALLTLFLEKEFANSETLHGDLVEVHGLGILILGNSGIGKSECALELIERGQRLIADDLVIIKRVGNVLVGEPSEDLGQHIEIRGIGIINIEKVFGMDSIASKTRIELAVTLEFWDKDKEYDRLGLDEEYMNILGMDISKILIPVKPGRNLSVIIEAAAMNHRLKKMGYHSAKEFDKKLKDKIKR